MGRLANMGNRQATEEISKLMDAKGVPMSEIVDTVEEYCAQLDDSASDERDEIKNLLSVMVRRSNGDASASAAQNKKDVEPARSKDKVEVAEHERTPSPAAEGARTPSPEPEHKKEKK